jgi:hypothetical protein
MPGLLPSRGVFLSYRREDAAPYARLLQFQLRERLPDARVFMDLDSIEPGLDFAEVIGEAVGSCVVLVALIGHQWATLTDAEGHRRLDNPDDYVRFEVQAALERGVRVIPVLVDGANPLRQQQLPAELQKLARLNALELSYGRYEYDADRLVNIIQQVLAAAPAVPPVPPAADADLGPLLTGGADPGYASPTVTPAPALHEHQADAPGGNDLVTGWQLADQREGQVYQWPGLLEHYDRYHVYKGETQREGTVFIALGWAVRHDAWGRDRTYVISFLSQRAPQMPLTEFLATDDYTETGELIAIIRGSDGGRKMYSLGQDLPPAYARFRITPYRDRVQAKGAWNKLAVVSDEHDIDTILNHALIQARRRGDL